MKQSSKRLFTLLIALLLFFGAFVIFISFTEPAYTAAQKVKSDAASRENLVANEKSAIDQVKKLIASYQGQDQLKQVVALALPAQKDEAGVLHEVNSLALSNHLSVQAIVATAPSLQNVSAAAKTPTVSLIKPVGVSSVEIKIVGTYGDFKAFLKNLETNIRVFDIRSITVDPVGKPNQDVYAYDVIVATYYQNQ